MINIVIPMAGLGSRFTEAGFTKPKPFIDIDGKPMVVRVMENLSSNDARYILIARQEHILSEQLMVRKIEKEYNAKFISIDKVTEGTACTVMFARKDINNDYPLLIANSDQIVDIRMNDFIDDCKNRELDGSILCFDDIELNPKWSFAKTDENGYVVQVKEKEAISNLATVGIYLFSSGKDFVNGAIDMIINNDRVKNEFYTCPVYNYLINDGKKIGTYCIDFYQMHGLGTPEDLRLYLDSGSFLNKV
jgi:dTDP-glucose pyrophosphorylase